MVVSTLCRTQSHFFALVKSSWYTNKDVFPGCTSTVGGVQPVRRHSSWDYGQNNQPLIHWLSSASCLRGITLNDSHATSRAPSIFDQKEQKQQMSVPRPAYQLPWAGWRHQQYCVIFWYTYRIWDRKCLPYDMVLYCFYRNLNLWAVAARLMSQQQLLMSPARTTSHFYCALLLSSAQ